jgi:hypothetical protein
LTDGGVAAGNGGGGQIEWNAGLLRPQAANERERRGDFAYRYGVQPDGAGLRPRERLGQKAQAFEEMSAIGTAKENSAEKIKEDKGK